MSLTIYEFDTQRVYTGTSKVLGPREGIPRNWTHIAPPDGEGYHIFDGVKWFTRNEYPKRPEPAPEKRHITVGAFFDRFGEKKWSVLSSPNALVQTLIQDCAVRRYIDLDNSQSEEGLDMLIAEGFELDKEALLSAPIEDTERP